METTREDLLEWREVSAGIASARDLRTRLAGAPAPGSFSGAELETLPGPVRRYFEAAVTPGTPLATSARFRMVGSIKLGERWVPFRARQIEAPHHGFVWSARAGVIVGSDRYTEGAGAMNWRVLGLVRVMHADGPDVSRSAAGRVGAEAVWVPTALLPRFGVMRTAADPHHIKASYHLDEAHIELHYTLGDDARVRSVVFDRWGDPDKSGTWLIPPPASELMPERWRQTDIDAYLNVSRHRVQQLSAAGRLPAAAGEDSIGKFGGRRICVGERSAPLKSGGGGG
jgi:hypothetical protein